MEPLEVKFTIACAPARAFDLWARRTSLWEPPRRLAHLWHLRQDRADATEVEVMFAEHDDARRVTIVHRGWERLGAKGPELLERNRSGWGGLLPHYIEACQGDA